MPYTYVLLLFFTLSTTWYFIFFIRLSKGALSRAKMYDISTYLHVDPKILIKKLTELVLHVLRSS